MTGCMCSVNFEGVLDQPIDLVVLSVIHEQWIVDRCIHVLPHKLGVGGHFCKHHSSQGNGPIPFTNTCTNAHAAQNFKTSYISVKSKTD